MATVYVPIGMRSLTGGLRTVSASGRTVAAVIDDLEANYPGFHESLVENGALKPGLAIAVNSEEQPLGLLARVPDQAEVHILPAMAGGESTASGNPSLHQPLVKRDRRLPKRALRRPTQP